jgi:anti-sigma factor RsiW
MNCNEARRHWNLYHDSEGDAALHFEISEHLAVCPGCAEWFARQSRLEGLLAEKLGPQPPTAALWNQVLEACGFARPARPRRWFVLAGIAAGLAAALVVLAWWGGLFRPADPTDLARLTAAWHQRLAAGGEPLQIRSRSDLEVEGYLRKRVAFPVRCPPRKDAGFAVEGAGVCRLGEQPAAYLLGQVGGAPVSIFILAQESLAAFPHQRDALGREKAHRCREGRLEMVMAVIDCNVVLVIGELEAEPLLRVLKAYGTYPDHPPG